MIISSGYFRVAVSLCFKARLSAKLLIWPWSVILMQIKIIFTRKVHLASFWKWVINELGNGLIELRCKTDGRERRKVGTRDKKLTYKICRTTFDSRVGWVTIYLLCVLAWPDCPEQMSSSLAYPASSSSRASCACTSAFSRKRSVPDRWRNWSSASSPWCSRVVETWLNRFDRCPATGVE